MNDVSPLKRKSVPPPLEPKLAYPEPSSSVELLALIRGTTFFAATRGGDLTPSGAPYVGLFRDDTRFLSYLQLHINGEAPIELSSTTVGADISRVELTARGRLVPGENLDLPVNTIYIHRQQFLEKDRFHETLQIENFHDIEMTITVELLFDADFMDIFQVRGLLRGKSGHYYAPEVSGSKVRFYYEGLDERSRATELSFRPKPQIVQEKRAHWEIKLLPHEQRRIEMSIAMDVGETRSQDEQSVRLAGHANENLEEARRSASAEHHQWTKDCTRFRSDNEIFDLMLHTSIEDFYALRIEDGGGTAVAAGVPWFAALFGRDSLLSSFETLVLNPDLAQGTLRILAAYQGEVENDERDEDPGKILHERRSGEMTATREVAFGRSYGSVDSTPLFLILAHEYMRWTGDTTLVKELGEALKSATEWILNCADLDGDGLIEYERRSPKGLFNQGWKDSGDANRHSDGSIAQPPIALIEVQGYAVRALAGAAEMLATLEEKELAAKATKRSKELRGLIEERFWQVDRTYYAMALDREKKPLRVDGSNPGHLLFAEAIDAERALQVSQKVLERGLFCGWGIRTLSSAEKYFNPMSYHCGSVWPHDNALIGYGMALYGLHREAATVFHALYDAALHFRDYRLPELFCGVTRQARSEPVHYPVSCSPQAWAAGAPFLLLTGLLGITPNATTGELAIVNPRLPEFLQELQIENMRVGDSRVTLHFKRDGERTHCNVVGLKGKELKISILFKPERN